MTPQNGAAQAQTTTIVEDRPPMTDAEVARILSMVDTSPERALDPKNMDELDRWAARVAASKMYGVQNADDAFMRITTGRELGLSAATSVRLLYSFETKGVRRIGLDASLMMALCLRRPSVCEYFRYVDSNEHGATFVTKRVGDPEVSLVFTFEEAKAAKLTGKDVWQAWPARMCEARCKSALARLVYPDILGGLYDADELRDEAEAEAKMADAVRAASGGRPPTMGVAKKEKPAHEVAPAPASSGHPVSKSNGSNGSNGAATVTMPEDPADVVVYVNKARGRVPLRDMNDAEVEGFMKALDQRLTDGKVDAANVSRAQRDVDAARAVLAQREAASVAASAPVAVSDEHDGPGPGDEAS